MDFLLTQILYPALFSVVGVVLCLGVLITIHELGHYVVARWCNVKVLCFSVGFGKALWSVRRGADNTEYRIAMIPLGGYVRMQDERVEALQPGDDVTRAFNRQSPARRAAIAVAGPLANFLLAIVAFYVAYLIGFTGSAPVVGAVTPNSPAEEAGIVSGERIIAVDGRPNRTWNEHGVYLLNRSLAGAELRLRMRDSEGGERDVLMDLSATTADEPLSAVLTTQLGMMRYEPPLPAVIRDVMPDSAAAQAGLAAGDHIVAVDGIAIADWPALATYISARPGHRVHVDFVRDGLRRQVFVVPRETRDEQGIARGRIGIGAASFAGDTERARHGPVEAMVAAVRLCADLSWLTVHVVWQMATLQLSSRYLSGPLTIVDYTGRAVRRGVDRLLLILGLLSISIAIFNLLPVPLLDGGHLLFCLIEAVRGAPLSPRVYIIGTVIGAALLAGIMSLALFNDIIAYFVSGAP